MNKKYLLYSILISIPIILGAVYIFAHEPPFFGDKEISSLTIDGVSREISYTDENEGEDLIIKSDKKYYFNLGGSITTYFSVFNNSKDDQDVDLVFSFNDDGDKKYVDALYEYDGEKTIKHPAYEIVTPAKITATSSSEEIIEYIEARTEEITLWKEVENKDFKEKTIERKDKKNTKSLKENAVHIKSGETKFFKADIKYTDFTDKEEFFVEAFGDKQSYGMLDPWVYEQLFNALNTAALTGQDSWATISGYSTGNVSEGDAFEGTKSAYITGTQGNIRAVTGMIDGTVYIAFKITSSGADMQLGLLDGAWPTNRITMTGQSNKIYYYVATVKTEYDAYTDNVWYVAKITLDGSENKFKLNIWEDGTGWLGETGWVAVSYGTVSEADSIWMKTWTSVSCYFDTITPNDPTVEEEEEIQPPAIMIVD